jgi:hypothetical protein
MSDLESHFSHNDRHAKSAKVEVFCFDIMAYADIVSPIESTIPPEIANVCSEMRRAWCLFVRKSANGKSSALFKPLQFCMVVPNY